MMTDINTRALVIMHNIAVAFDYLTRYQEDEYIRRLRSIESDICTDARNAITSNNAINDGEKEQLQSSAITV